MSQGDLSGVLLRPGIDEVLDSIRVRQRRLVLLGLMTGEIDNEIDLRMRASDPDTIQLELEHKHLPKLEEAGYIEWDRETGDISTGPKFDEIEPLLELIEEHADELPPDWP